MAVTITWPRHPRAGCSANSARATTISGKYWVQLRNTSNAYVNAMQVTTLKRAQDIAKRLNDLFANYPGADLDFITPSWENGCYVVAWSGTRATQNGSIYDTIGTKNDTGIVYENLYSGCYSDHICLAFLTGRLHCNGQMEFEALSMVGIALKIPPGSLAMKRM